jgi:hypothetical protein
MNASCAMNARECNKLRKCTIIGCIQMHMNAPCTKCSIENAYECKKMHQYQNASYMNAYKCIYMQYHAAGEECILMKCNENDENTSKCINALECVC